MLHAELQKPKQLLFDNTSQDPNKNDTGRFTMEPWEPGHGLTIGNAYRRVLLSSLPGYAITTVKIPGISHEYSVIPGVLEDVTTLILNLKQVRFRKKLDAESDKISISISKKSVFKAGDIVNFTSSFEVLNPDHIICNFAPNTNLDIELTVQAGKGYVPANEIYIENPEIGVLTLDAIFSPVRNVSFFVENTRVGNKTDYDKLTLDIQTDGTITPEEALEKASRILIESFSVMLKSGLTDIEKGLLDSKIVTDSELRRRKLLKRPIKEFSEDLSTRSINCLVSAGIDKLEGLAIDNNIISKIPSLGLKSLKEIVALKAKHGIS
jgi:DNA-directed RNA polymerase subunit alpha